MQNFNTYGNIFCKSVTHYVLDTVAFLLIYSSFNLDSLLTMKVYNDNFIFVCDNGSQYSYLHLYLKTRLKLQ